MMGYEKSSTKLDGFIAEALRNEEIQGGAKRAELEEEFLASSLKEKASEIWETAAREIEAYEQLENTRMARLAELRAAEPAVDQGISLRARRWVSGVSTAVLIITGILVILTGSPALMALGVVLSAIGLMIPGT